MIPQNSGSIVNILTDAARIGEPRMVNYGAAKAGVGALSRGLAKEVARNNIRINCVSPSMTITELGKQRREMEKEKLGEEKFNKLQQKRLRLYPLGRLGEPQDIANAVIFLCSGRSSWITGQTLSVNGGYAIGPW
jgi:NAD(P)-dependent dehydrogenase (short-subunit alcohol dehydrogenase family)